MTADDVDRKLPAWLGPAVARSVKGDWRYPDDAPSYAAGWSLKDLDCTVAEAERALTILQALNVPAEDKEIVKAVVKLKLLTKWRGLEPDDLDAQVLLFGDELKAYPRDVVVQACETWAKGETFFPSWAELSAICDQLARKRRNLAAALEAWLPEARKREREAKREKEHPTYNRHWRARKDAMIEAVGLDFWHLWCDHLIPLDPERDKKAEGPSHYHLAARSEFIAAELPKRPEFKTLEQACERRLKVHYRAFAFKAWQSDTPPDPSTWESLRGVDRWLAAELNFAHDLGKWYEFHAARLFPIADDGQQFRIGTHYRITFDLVRGSYELSGLGLILKRDVEVKFIDGDG